MRKLGAFLASAVVAGLLLVVLAGGAGARQSRDWQDCARNEPDVSIAGCSRVIEHGGRETPRNRAIAHTNRGNDYINKGDIERAMADYEQAVRYDSSFSNAFNGRGRVYLLRKEYDRAIAEFEQCLRLDPKHPFARSNRAIAYSDKGDYDHAIADLDESIRLNPGRADLYELRGNSFRDKGDPRRALLDYDEALRAEPGRIGAFFDRGLAYQRLGDTDRALVDFDEAIRLNPKYIAPFGQRSLAYYRKGDYARALIDAKEFIRLGRTDNPAEVTDLDAAMLLGSALKEIKDFAGCADVFGKALAEIRQPEPAHWFIYFSRGNCYGGLHQTDKAEADFTKALELSPDEPQVLNTLAYGWVDRGIKVDEAVRMIKRAFEQKPDDGFIVDSLGWAYYRLGNYEEAMKQLDRAVKLNPGDPAIHDHLGDISWRAGRRGDAIAHWTQARSLNPAPDDARRIEVKLRTGLPEPAAVATGPAAPETTTSSSAPPPGPVAIAVPKSPRADEAPAKPSTRVALVIGNSAYKAVAALPNPRHDAEAVAAALRDVGFRTVRLETDLGREKFVEALRVFAREAEGADWAVVYFAGHGIEMGGVNYLLPVDARLETDRDAQFEAVALDQVMSAVDGARKLRLVLLDACRDNPFARQMRRTTASRSVGRGLARIEPDGGTLVVYAAKHGEVALDGEGGGNSPF
ncbi:MAG: tetratricopeptide repeat protein, partial [Xanthobacteraceae bacterium]